MAKKVVAKGNLECCICGEYPEKVYQIPGHQACQQCYEALVYLVEAIETLANGCGCQGGTRAPQTARDRVIREAIRLFCRAGHKARVRVRQHVEQVHEPFVQDPALRPNPRS